MASTSAPERPSQHRRLFRETEENCGVVDRAPTLVPNSRPGAEKISARRKTRPAAAKPPSGSYQLWLRTVKISSRQSANLRIQDDPSGSLTSPRPRAARGIAIKDTPVAQSNLGGRCVRAPSLQSAKKCFNVLEVCTPGRRPEFKHLRQQLSSQRGICRCQLFDRLQPARTVERRYQ
jgi:hypothetical protein